MQRRPTYRSSSPGAASEFRRNLVPRVALLSLLTLGVACDATDSVVVDIGTTRLYVVDPALRPQIIDIESNQVAEFKIQSASFSVAGTSYDLLFGEDCLYRGTSEVPSFTLNRCGAGLVIDSGDEAVPVQLDITLSMAIRRATPLLLQPNGDFDTDGILDDGDFSGKWFDRPCRGGETVGCDDNCVMIANPDQADLNGDSIGDACTVVNGFTGQTLLDSDVDVVPDIVDNCVWVYNPDQRNTTGLAASGIPDGIGDACEEEISDIRLSGSRPFALQLESQLLQPFRTVTQLTVDINSQSALTCDWNVGTCSLDPNLVQFCVIASALAASGGCP